MFKSKVLTYVAVGASMLCVWPAVNAEKLNIATPKTSMVLDATKDKPLKFLYYGDRIADNELDAISESGAASALAYPEYGFSHREAAIAAIHGDGNVTLDLVVDKVNVTDVDGKKTITVTLKDKYYPFYVDVNYLTYNDGQDVIETWTEVWHDEKKPVTLTQFASGCLPVRYGDVWMTQLYGSWGNEARLDTAPLNHGMKVVKSREGVRNAHGAHPEVMLSLDGQPRENSGRVIGAVLCYGGNYKLRVDTDNSLFHQLFAGINEDNAQYKLAKGERFVTPALALTYSDTGLGGASRNFHRWGRDHKIAHGRDLRKVLLNSWEGVYFNIKEKEMHQMMKDIADMGGELFVMDDGWFGDKYPRNDGTSSLGDWTVDTNKLPNGIQGLIDAAKANGIKFGIWIEPEMTDKVSRLMEEHPEYAIKPANHDIRYGRGGAQMVLDLSNPKVQDLVFHMVDTLLTSYPEIDYIKWDCNGSAYNHASQYLPADKQSQVYIDYNKGLIKTLERIRAKYPDVTIQACGGGGARATYGVMPWFDEFWVSDNTDALQRVYLQWGTSYFYPAVAMASHISDVPNHQTRRTTPLKYRIDVAMAGRLGMEIQPKNMTDEEKDICRNAIAQYKEIRPIVQQGDLYRLLSPYDKKGAASLMYVDPETGEAVYFWWKTESFVGEQLPRVAMAGLDPDKQYRVTELNRIDTKPLKYEGKTFSGKFLMTHGLEMPNSYNVPKSKRSDLSSRVLRLTPVK